MTNDGPGWVTRNGDLFFIIFERFTPPGVFRQWMPTLYPFHFLSFPRVDWQNNLGFQLIAPFRIRSWWTMNASFVGGWKRFSENYMTYPLTFAYSRSFGSGGQRSEVIDVPRRFSRIMVPSLLIPP